MTSANSCSDTVAYNGCARRAAVAAAAAAGFVAGGGGGLAGPGSGASGALLPKGPHLRRSGGTAAVQEEPAEQSWAEKPYQLP
jgi:hypothetical protein